MSIQESFKLIPQTIAGQSVLTIEFDLVGERANKWNTQTMTRFKEILTELKSSPHKLIIFRSGKSKIFIAGADIDEIKNLTTK